MALSNVSSDLKKRFAFLSLEISLASPALITETIEASFCFFKFNSRVSNSEVFKELFFPLRIFFVSSFISLSKYLRVSTRDLTKFITNCSSSGFSGLMRSAYSSSSVPGGWLIALPFVKLGRQYSADSEVAKIRLIVPSTEGHTYASNGVYACFYEIIMQRGR